MSVADIFKVVEAEIRAVAGQPELDLWRIRDLLEIAGCVKERCADSVAQVESLEGMEPNPGQGSWAGGRPLRTMRAVPGRHSQAPSSLSSLEVLTDEMAKTFQNLGKQNEYVIPFSSLVGAYKDLANIEPAMAGRIKELIDKQIGNEEKRVMPTPIVAALAEGKESKSAEGVRSE